MLSANQPSGASAVDCIHCGVSNPPGATACQRCGAGLRPIRKSAGFKRLLLKSVIRIVGLTFVLLFLGYASLITTSDPILPNQEKQVYSAIDVLEGRGFKREAFVLRRLVRYRATDNWWNRYVGHESAYAATNFPFEVVTLYPQFFSEPTDDVERAAILLHESYHLFGHGEARAFECGWRDRQQLGWVRDLYNFTKVWMSVKEATQRWAPQLFKCGEDGRSDCTESDR